MSYKLPEEILEDVKSWGQKEYEDGFNEGFQAALEIEVKFRRITKLLTVQNESAWNLYKLSQDAKDKAYFSSKMLAIQDALWLLTDEKYLNTLCAIYEIED